KKVEILARIAKLYELYWLCEGEYNGFIQTQILKVEFDTHIMPKVSYSISIPNILDNTDTAQQYKLIFEVVDIISQLDENDGLK
ncbi:7404_t:CDS:2, partial [Funneliformis geosporum]